MSAAEPYPVPSTDIGSIPDTVARARAAFDSGRTRPLDWRREQLRKLRAMVVENADELVAALRADLSKPELEALTTDVQVVAGEVDAALKGLERWTRPEKVATPLAIQPARSRLVREPLGVVLIIGPWNYPVQLVLLPLIGAIAAGNAAVIKPSEVTPTVSNTLGRLLPRYLDPDAFAVVEGAVDETTALLDERFDHVFYTGNGTVGRIVMAAAARHLTPVTLELGGKSPCIVDESADLEVAANRIAWGKFLNAGQTCIAPDYVLVAASREDELIEKLGAAVRAFYGDDPASSPDFARIVNSRHHERLVKLLESGDAVVGGQSDARTGYIAPTVLRNVSPESPAMRDEIFGPILPVLTIESVEEAIAFVNRREKPLALYVFSASHAVQEAVVARTSSGGVCVNGTIWHIANMNLPFGGVGPSGMGAYHGRHSFETFSHRKAVVTKSTRLDPKMIYPPYGGWKTQLVKKLLR